MSSAKYQPLINSDGRVAHTPPPKPASPSSVSKALIVVAIIVALAIAAVIAAIVLTTSSGGGVAFAGAPLPSSPRGGLVFVYRTDQTRPNGERRLVARSYDGHEFEAVRDEDFAPVNIVCPPDKNCTITTEGSYEVEYVQVPEQVTATTERKRLARLLLQGTFGFTEAELEQAFNDYSVDPDYSNWLEYQMALPPTLLRSYYRQRVNVRHVADDHQGSVWPICEDGSRWHSYAFNYMDLGHTLTVKKVGNKFQLLTRGVVRTEVAGWPKLTDLPATAPAERNFTMCIPTERIGGPVRYIDTGAANPTVACRKPKTFSNPRIVLSAPQAAISQTITARPVAVRGRNEEVRLFRDIVGCDEGRKLNNDAYVRVATVWYRFDPRLKTLQNTLSAPADVPAGDGVQCPAVKRNFINGPQCVRRESCAPPEYTSAPVLLNEANMRKWFNDDGRYVYTVRGLRLQDVYAVSPCKGNSRWAITNPNGPCATETTLPANAKTPLAASLAASTDANPNVRDIRVTATCNGVAATIGASITVNNKCFTHVHPDEFDVRDFTSWTERHDGNLAATAAGRPNPIRKWALAGGTTIHFPADHPVDRWRTRQTRMPLVGRLGDTVDFTTLTTDLQTSAMAVSVGASVAGGRGFEVCGSPGEAANIPELGAHYLNSGNDRTNKIRQLDRTHDGDSGKSMVWVNTVLTAKDQFRHRAAWALSQICVMSTQGIGLQADMEFWFTYYDIFVRNAFGNYKDILKEVSYNPIMSRYLSYRQNKAFAVTKNFPDENYAREIMQLFSIGLWKLNDDGTRILDDAGEPVPTYTIEDIVDFARIWTGFDLELTRSNYERLVSNGFSLANHFDPMRIREQWRDRFPKTNLAAGFIGDGRPLCDALPANHWMRMGARYVLTGSTSDEGSAMLVSRGTYRRGMFSVNSSSESALFDTLCAPQADGTCAFPTAVTLAGNLRCSGIECDVDRVTVVEVVDLVGGTTQYYSYESVPCVRLAFFEQGKKTGAGAGYYQCAAAHAAVGMPVCCRADDNLRVASNYGPECRFNNEHTTWNTAKRRCEAQGLVMCGANYTGQGSFASSCSSRMNQWLDASCKNRVQVYPSGRIGIVDPLVTDKVFEFTPSSGNVFRVLWADGAFPKPESGCGVGCETLTVAEGESCLCDATTEERAVFSRGAVLPSVEELERVLHVGAVDPSGYLDRENHRAIYTLCRDSPCDPRAAVQVYTRGDSEWDAHTIFSLPPRLEGHARRYLLNRVSVVRVGTHSFRNPPTFMPLAGEVERVQQWSNTKLLRTAAENEVDELITHLHERPSTAPFVCYRLIQRLVTSNPSPRYMRVCVEAFRTGTYLEFGKGNYGDLEATFAAIMLDREARTVTLDADPTFGVLREPLLKVIHVLRAFEFKAREREVQLVDMFLKLNQDAFDAPSVFGYYLTEHRPAGGIDDGGLVAPEFELLTAPLIVNYLNGMTSLIDYGLSACHKGFGRGGSCATRQRARDSADGLLEFDVGDGASPESVIDRLDMLLTAGRLTQHARDLLLEQYVNAREGERLSHVQKLMIAAPEFHATQAQVLRTAKRTEPAEEVSLERPFKAIVVIFLAGGADSFNLVIPHSGCPAKDMHAEYETVRQGAAIGKTDLAATQIPVADQVCSTFAVHPSMPQVTQLYKEGDAAFFANIGAMVEPATPADFKKTSARPAQLPPSLFAHNIMQRHMHNLHAQNAAAKGVLARVVDSMRTMENPFKSDLYSLFGTPAMLTGSKPVNIIDPTAGVVQFEQHDELTSLYVNLTERESPSLFHDTYSTLLRDALKKTQEIGGKLAAVNLTHNNFGDTALGKQMRQVAKLINLRGELKTERAVFMVRSTGWDTHATFNLDPLWGSVDTAIGALKEELVAKGAWDDTVVVTVSDFARTLTSNGKGTDHAWGGNHVLAGGSLKGGKMFGTYPDALSDDGSQHLGRGRLMPTTPWEGMWRGILEWYGVPPAQMDMVLPNLKNFQPQHTFGGQDMFNI